MQFLDYLSKERERDEAKGENGNQEQADEEMPDMDNSNEGPEDENQGPKKDESENDVAKKPKDDKEKQEYKKENLVALNSKVIKLLIPAARNYGRIFYDKQKEEFVGYDRQAKELVPIKEISLDDKANSVNQEIHGTEGKEHEHINAKRIFNVNDEKGIAVVTDGLEKGDLDFKYVLRRRGTNEMEDRAFVPDLPLLSSQGTIGSTRATDVSGEKEGIYRGTQLDQANDEIDELDEIDIPEEIIDRFDEKMDSQTNGIKSVEELKAILVEVVIEKLDNDYPNDFPGAHKEMASKMVDAMVDENIDYEKAKEEALGNDREEGGRTPDEKRSRR